MNKKEISILLSVMFFIVQLYCYWITQTTSKTSLGNITIDTHFIGFLIFVITLVKFSKMSDYFLCNAMWTIGFYIVFQKNYTSISGSFLLIAASLLLYFIHSKEKLLE